MNHHPRSENGQVNTDHLTTRLLPTEDPDDLVLDPLESVLYTRNKTRSFTEWLNPPHYPRAVQVCLSYVFVLFVFQLFISKLQNN